MSSPLVPGRLVTRGRQLIDRFGRSVLLRGVNYSGRHKEPPHTLGSGPEDFARLAAAGFNVIRLVLVWEAIEPEPDRYDEDYLARVEALARAAGAAGLHVIVDLHQDLYARAFGGSGAPAWTIPNHLSTNNSPDRYWFVKYATDLGVRHCLARFWTNEDGIQDHFIRATAHAASRLVHLDAVIGWDLYNEPFAGDLALESFETEQLERFYKRTIAAVRRTAPGWLAFFEGALLTSEQGTSLALELPGIVYFPHFYDKTAVATRCFDGNTQELDQALSRFEADAARMNVPWMLGEYGFVQDGQGGPALLEAYQHRLDRYGSGSTAWHYNPTEQEWNDENMSLVGPGGESTPLFEALVWPYAMAVAGRLLSQSFDLQTNTYQLQYQVEADGGAPTVVFVPKARFPKCALNVSGASPNFRADEQRLYLEANAGELVTVQLQSS